jgi:pyruvate, water dikinase
MSWLQPLDQVCANDLTQVGYKAYTLGLLGRQQLPVATGQIIPAQAWQEMMTTAINPAISDYLADLDRIDRAGFHELQRLSQQAQQALATADLPATLVADLANWPHPIWILRASFGCPLTRQQADLGLGILPAQMGSAALVPLAKALQQFWTEVLSARSLMVWRHRRQAPAQLPLATLVMPVYPALVSGTLRLGAKQATWDCVEGLGLPLTRGEAIPARGQMTLAQPASLQWQPGFQEQVYRILPRLEASSLAMPRLGMGGSVMGGALRVMQRDDPTLASPLTPEQVDHLLDLGQRSRQVLASDPWVAAAAFFDLGLEWVLCPDNQGEGWQFWITQVIPYFPPPPPSSPVPGVTPVTVSSPSFPPSLPRLPTINTVVKGIGASAGQVQGIAVVARQPRDLPRPLPANAIVVLPDLQPDVFFQLTTVAGIVTEQGGATCHAAILAREIGIPAVVGAPQATQLLDDAMPLFLDGNRGLIYGLDASRVPPLMADPQAPLPLPRPLSHYPALRTKVMANLSQLRRLDTLPVDHIAGVGLLRSEWLLLDILEGRHPWHWVNEGQGAELQSRISQQLEPILKVLGSKPLRYRSLDLRSHEWQALVGSPPLEPNPMLGLRGTLSYNIDARLFEVELGALATLQRAGYTNLELILPFVRTVEEVLACRQYIQRVGLMDYEGFALWIMAEVPSVLFSLPAYAQAGVHGITIGSNDLTQLLLAVDRDQPTMASAYDERHPVIQMAMAHLIQEAHRCGLICSICGQAPVRHPDLIAKFITWGIHSISVETAALPFILETIWQAEQPSS